MGILGEDDGAIFCRIYDVSEVGNFEDKNILHPILTLEQASKYFRKKSSEIERIIAKAKQKLFGEREKRIKPFRDEKIITAWNGLMLSGLAEAIKISPQPLFIDAAKRTIDFIFAKCVSRRTSLAQLTKTAKRSCWVFLTIMHSRPSVCSICMKRFSIASALERAIDLGEIMLRDFWDEKGGGFFYTGVSHEKLISRAKPIFDASIPSGNAMATQLLLRLYHMTGDDRYYQHAERVLRSYYEAMESQPSVLRICSARWIFIWRKRKKSWLSVNAVNLESTNCW